MNLTIFQKPFWLDAVAPGQWASVEVKRGDRIAATMPYATRRGPFGGVKIMMPPLTQTLGPVFSEAASKKYVEIVSERQKLLGELIEKLPRFDLFEQNFDHRVTDWLPLYWRNFSQTTRYTYVFQDLTDLDAIWAGMRKNIKTDIRKAERQVAVRSDLPVDRFIALNHEVFSRQGLRAPYSESFIKRIDAACARENCRETLFAEDASGRLHAAVYLVWDEMSMYYLMSGSEPDLRRSGATSFLLWEAIQLAASMGLQFNFEGSMIREVERHFRAFGAVQVPYFRVTKINSFSERWRPLARRWLLRGR